MDKFRDLTPKFIQFCDRIVPLLKSGELVLPIGGAIERKSARIFKNKLMHFREFVELLEAITKNKSFRNYFDKAKSEFEAWEEPDATHLTEMNWFAVEMVRILLEDVYLSKKDPYEMLQVLSDFIDKKMIDAPVYIHFKSNLKIEINNSEEALDENVRFQFKGGKEGVFKYTLSTRIKFIFTDDYRYVKNLNNMYQEVYKILGKLITALILMNVPFNTFLLSVIAVRTYEYILYAPNGIWPSAQFAGLNLRSDIFAKKRLPINPELASSSTKRPHGRFASYYKDQRFFVQFNTLKEVWLQLNQLESRIKGLDRRLVVIGKRSYQIIVNNDEEDVLLFFCMLLESLVIKAEEQEGLSHKFAQRAALLTSLNNKNLNKMFNWFKKLYKIRSKILHGKAVAELEIKEDTFSDEKDEKKNTNFESTEFKRIEDILEGPLILGRNILELYVRIVKRIFKLSFIKSDFYSYDQLIDFIDSAVLDHTLQDEIFKIE